MDIYLCLSFLLYSLRRSAKMMRDLFELDADYAEALWALDHPPGRIDVRAMVR
jgi:hypothetical protein